MNVYNTGDFLVPTFISIFILSTNTGDMINLSHKRCSLCLAVHNKKNPKIRVPVRMFNKVIIKMEINNAIQGT